MILDKNSVKRARAETWRFRVKLTFWIWCWSSYYEGRLGGMCLQLANRNNLYNIVAPQRSLQLQSWPNNSQNYNSLKLTGFRPLKWWWNFPWWNLQALQGIRWFSGASFLGEGKMLLNSLRCRFSKSFKGPGTQASKRSNIKKGYDESIRSTKVLVEPTQLKNMYSSQVGSFPQTLGWNWKIFQKSPTTIRFTLSLWDARNTKGHQSSG